MRTKILPALALAALLASCGAPVPETPEGTGAAAGGSGAAVPSWDGTAYVAEARGDVSVRARSGKNLPAVAGVTSVGNGASVETGENSEATVAFPDGSALRLAPLSRAEFLISEGSGATVALSRGALWARTLPSSAPSAYSLAAEGFSAAVPGTSAYLAVSASGTVFEVHDSAGGSGAAAFWNGEARNVGARTRLSVPGAGTGAAEESAFVRADAFSDEFKRTSLERDLALLSRILRERRLPEISLRGAREELDASLPENGAELGALIRDARVFERGAGTGSVAKYGPNETFSRGEAAILDAVERDLAISVVRQKYARRALRALKSLRDGSSDDAVLDAKRDADAEIRAILRPGPLDAGLRARLVDLTEPDPDPEETPRVRPLRDELPKRPAATGSSLPSATGAAIPENPAPSSEAAPRGAAGEAARESPAISSETLPL